MSTYQDKQKLADLVYDKKTTIISGSKTWTVVEGFSKEASSGYYGAVYTNGKGEYVLASRGTQNFTNKVHDGEMHVFSEVPPEFIDAYQLAAKATAYVQAHGGTLSFDGHSLGGTISQLLAVTFGGEATAFNPYNSKNFLDSVERVDQSLVSGLISRKNELQQQIANGELSSQSDLDIVNQQLIRIEANNKLYDAWNGGHQYDITNYRIENDQVSGATDNPLLGETITIKYDSKGDSQYESTVLGHHAIGAFGHDIETFHGIDNFSVDNLVSSGDDVTLKDSLGSSNALLELAELFKDKSKFEVDQIGAGLLKIGQEHELFIGLVDQRSDWASTGNTRSQLITSQGDSVYTKVNLAAVGTAADITAKAQQSIEYMLSQKYASGYAMYGIKHNESHADKQTYILFEKLPDKKETQQYDPLALDLDNSGKVETVGLSAGILFDMDADNVKTGTGWVASGDGLVVRDINKNGQIDSGREIFGDNTILSNGQKAKNAFEAIADLDVNKDGKVDIKDAAFNELKIWQDKNQNGISEVSELKTLTELGITSISTKASITGVQNAANGNVEIGFSSFERADGSTGNSGAFNFVGNPIDSEFTDTVDTSLVEDIPNTNGSGRVRDLREAAALSSDLASAVRNYMSKDYPSEADIETVVKLWAQTGQMDTIASTLKTGEHPAGARGTNLSTSEINKLGVLEKFTGLYVATTNFIDPMDAQDGKVDGRYTDKHYGINIDANSINNSYNSLKIEVEKDLALASGKTSVFNLVDYKIQDGKVTMDLSRTIEWIKAETNHEYAISQLFKLANDFNSIGNALFTKNVSQQTSHQLIDLLFDDNSYLLSGANVENAMSKLSAVMNLYGDLQKNSLIVSSFDTNKIHSKILGIIEKYSLIDNDELAKIVLRSNDNSLQVEMYESIAKNTPNVVDVNKYIGSINSSKYGTEISDNLNGSVLSDYVHGLTGNDTIYGQGGNDILFGDAGNDVIDSGLGDDIVYGGSGNDSIKAGGGSDVLYGGDGNDTIDSTLAPTGYQSLARSTVFAGGAGDDYLVGSLASDIYRFSRGDGHDVINDYDDPDTGSHAQYTNKYGNLTDVIEFGAGISKEDLSFSKSGNDLVINIGTDGADSITIKNGYSNSRNYIEQIIFTDGARLTKDEYLKNLSVNLTGTDANDTLTSAGGNDTIIAKGGNDTITSGAGRDTIDAGSGDDTINAGTGNDSTTGGSGNDTYIYKAGDGQDTIRDISGTDTLNLQSIQASALKFTQDNNDLLINFTNTSSDSIRVSEWFSSADNRIEQLKLDDGSILDLNAAVEAQLITKYGTSSDDILELTGAKTQVIAGTGNDTITDTTANNTTYIFNKGDGKDTIIESNSTADTIQLNNITPQEISYSKIDNDLIINLGADDSITIKDFTNRANRIENISFNNGMTMLLAEALASAKVFGNDKTVTSNADDNLWLEQGAKINLREGNNQAYINSNGIATTVTSGAGNDNVEVYDNANVTLNLGNGNNSALVQDGNHAITTGTGSDTIALGTGISSLNVGDGNDNVTITKTQANGSFTVSLGAGNDSLKVNGAGGIVKVSNLSGDDTFNLANINTQISASGGNNLINLDNSGLAGDVNSISLAAGDDQLSVNSSGQTTIRAGEGTNQINLEGGGTFSVFAGGGDDQVKIQDLANSSLNLGNGNNIILGQDGKHVITTGTGNDNVTLGAGIASSINVGDGNDNVTITKTQADSSFSVSLGAGNDSLKVNGAGGIVKVNNLSGDDTFNLANINTQINASGGNNLINLDNSGITGDVNSISLVAGNDQLTVNSSGQTTISAGDGANQINLGGGGTFNVSAGGGDDQVKIQGLANSTLSLGNGNNAILTQDGNHRITTGSRSDSITLGAGISTISSGDGDDNVTITTTQNTNKYTINLGAGNDSLNFNGNGGELASVTSSSGNDQININNIRSQITLSSGDNTVNLNNSQLSGESNVISTGAGNDTIAVNSNGINTINAGNGTNQITLSGNSSNTVTSGSGNDVVRSNAGSLTLNSGTGDDSIEINSSNAQDKLTLSLGDGNDTVKISATGAATTIANNYGDDSYDLTGTQVKLSDTLGNTTLILNNQQLTNDVNTITTGVGNDNINITSNGSNTINAGNGNNQITISGNSKDTITSGSGDDVILAGAGDDIINAGSGNDTMVGGTGNDVLNGSTGNDSYIFNKGDGADIIQDAGGNDVMKLGEGIKKEDLWFKKDNKDLTINNLTNQDQMTVKNWYAGSANKIEQIELADGEHISNISIDLLVQAMATFDVKPMAESSLTPSQQNTIQNALANTWVDPTK